MRLASVNLARILNAMVRVGSVGASAVALGVAMACGGTAVDSTRSGGASDSGGASGTAANGGASGSSGSPSAGAGGVGGRSGCTADTDCGYPLVCLTCKDGTEQCPVGASCVDGACVIRYTHECSAGGGIAGFPGSGGAVNGTGGASAGSVTIEFSVAG